MSNKAEEFLKRLRIAFKSEAQERLTTIFAGLIKLEEQPPEEEQGAIVESIFREAHSLKGAARAVNLAEVEGICQAVESVFAALKRKEAAPSPTLLDRVQRAMEAIRRVLAVAGDEQAGIGSIGFESIINELADLKNRPGEDHAVETMTRRRGDTRMGRTEDGFEHLCPDSQQSSPSPCAHPVPAAPSPSLNSPALSREGAGPADAPAREKTALFDTVRIATAKLDSLFLQAQEMLALKLTARQRTADLMELTGLFDVWKKESIKKGPERQGLLDHGRLQVFENRLKGLVKSAAQDQRTLGGMVDHLLEDMKKVLMLPFSSLLETFPMMVREVSRDQGKEVELVVRGGEIELDRRILEEMKDPLIHLLRNAIDHGVEKPEVREQKGKPRRGVIQVNVSQLEGNRVEVVIADDGAGIDPTRVREAAIRRGVIPEREAGKLSEPEVLALIFQSEVSTSQIITSLSGRGLGLAIVRERVDNLGGSVSIVNQPQHGSSFRILLPVTLATFRGILVRAGERLFVIPTASVDRVLKIPASEMISVENKPTIGMNGQRLALVGLGDVLELRGSRDQGQNGEHMVILVLASGERRIAFRVDEVVNEQEVLIKSLGKQLSRVRNVAGATVLGSGSVVPVLNVSDLVKSAVNAPSDLAVDTRARKESEAGEASILVVEDSITSRTLLKNILESAGYTVRVAVDGVDAYTLLKTEEIDLVVSDVEMPRMNGFDLTAKIRSDSRLAEMPVVLVTGLESREDREQGIDVGANAYIVKSGFDQSNLLEVIRQLI
jgi:two-component system chemotaxis sensor kinase CheA